MSGDRAIHELVVIVSMRTRIIYRAVALALAQGSFERVPGLIDQLFDPRRKICSGCLPIPPPPVAIQSCGAGKVCPDPNSQLFHAEAFQCVAVRSDGRRLNHAENIGALESLARY